MLVYHSYECWSRIPSPLGCQHSFVFFLNIFSAGAVQFGWTKWDWDLAECKRVSGSREEDGKNTVV